MADQVAGGAGSVPPPSVLVPVGVLKRHGSTADASSVAGAGGLTGTPRTAQENKSVIFSDGIRPGGDLTDLDGSMDHRPLGRRPLKVKNRRVALRGGRNAAVTGDLCTSKLPPVGLPLVSGELAFDVVHLYFCVFLTWGLKNGTGSLFNALFVGVQALYPDRTVYRSFNFKI